MKNSSSTRQSRKPSKKSPSDSWFASKDLALCHLWLTTVENYERCGFGTPKTRYIGQRMRERIAQLEAVKAPLVAATQTAAA
jgi:hypothetical protein